MDIFAAIEKPQRVFLQSFEMGSFVLEVHRAGKLRRPCKQSVIR